MKKKAGYWLGKVEKNDWSDQTLHWFSQPYLFNSLQLSSFGVTREKAQWVKGWNFLSIVCVCACGSVKLVTFLRMPRRGCLRSKSTCWLVDIALRNVGGDGLVLVRKGLTVTQLFLCISYFILQCFPGFWGLLQKDRVNTKHIYIFFDKCKY